MAEIRKVQTEFTDRELWRMGVPLVIEQTLNMTVGLVDSLMVAQVGEAAVSAVALVNTASHLLENGLASLAAGGAIIAGQYLGRREEDKAGRSGAQLLLAVLEVSLVIMALFYLGKRFVLGVVFGSMAPDVAAYADTYYRIVGASIPFMAVYSAGAALFRVMGNSRVSMWISLLKNILNAAGNAVLIFGFHMQVEGVAIPTLVSRAVAALAVVLLLRRPGLPFQVRRFTPKHDLYVMKNILRFGLPNGMENSVFELGKILLLSTVTAFGTASVAANAMGNSICAFMCMPSVAMGFVMVSVVSRCVGAGDMEKARFYARKLLRMAYGMMAAMTAAILLLLPLILRAYDVSAEAEAYARKIIWMYAVAGVLFWPTAFTLPQALRAAGDGAFTMTVSIVSMWTMRVGLAIFLGRTLAFGVVGVWAAMIADWVLRAVVFRLRFRGHRWEHMGVK